MSSLRYLRGRCSFDSLPHDVAIRLAYNTLLDRDPDEQGGVSFREWLQSGRMTNQEMLAAIRSSEEFANCAAYRYRELGPSIHLGRGIFVRSLPPARRILDLGGSSTISDAGAFVEFGYPYRFEELVIVELPSSERHERYAAVKGGDVVSTPLGPVRYRYHSMVDLSGLRDASFDLVYSGQTIEHVPEHEAKVVLAEVHRVLRPGGFFALDTPNGPVCRLAQEDFIDPDHKVEYSHAEISRKLADAGFTIVRRHGLNHGGDSVRRGVFDPAETVRRWGLYADVESCYILAYLCQKAS